MALTLRSVTSNSQDNTSSAVRASFAMEAGKLYVALCAAGGTTPGTETLTSASGNTWTRRKQQLGASSDCVASVWTFEPSSDGGDTIDYYNNGDLGARGIWIYEIGGDWDTDFSSTFGVGSSGTHQVSCTGLASINSVVISAGFCRSDGTAETANGSSVLIGNLQFPVAGAWNSFYLYGTGATSITLGTTESSANWCMAVLEIKNVLDSIGLSEQVTPGDSVAFSIPVQTGFQPAFQQNAFQEYGGTGGADPLARSLSEQVSPTDSYDGKARAGVDLFEQAAPTDSYAATERAGTSLSESVSPTDSYDGKARAGVGLSEQAAPTDNYDYTWTGPSAVLDLSEAVSPTDSYAGKAAQKDSLSEQAGATDSYDGKARAGVNLSEQAAPTDTVAASSLRSGASLSEAVSPTDSYAVKASYGASLSEAAVPTDSFQGYLRIPASLSEQVSPSDSYARSDPPAPMPELSEQVTPTDAYNDIMEYYRQKTIVEQVSPYDYLQFKLVYGKSLSEQAFPGDAYAVKQSTGLVESLSPSDSYDGVVHKGGKLVEQATPGDAYAVAGKTARGTWMLESVSPGDAYDCSLTIGITVQRRDVIVTDTQIPVDPTSAEVTRRDIGGTVQEE